ncbi:uncharacterized protein V1516DRAFT_681707 [Lipomyces oligophaga]|uniref:uncharacterized protein n=1 Tax=Lipomyces oligophaga TaxID=45792 RepID=UPI0034CE4EA7
MEKVADHGLGRAVKEHPHFRLQLNSVEVYQAPPSSLDLGCSPLGSGSAFRFAKVPIVNFYGISDTDQNVCAHIHGVYPYLFVSYSGSTDAKLVSAYIFDLYNAINNALAAAFHLDNSNEFQNFVGNIVLCRAVPFYGFHVGWCNYLKIYMLSPSHMGRLAELLRGGSILNTVFEIFEAHIPYVLQFLIDFNLYGCGWMNLSKVRFRSPVPPRRVNPSVSYFEWTDATIKPEEYCASDEFPRRSYSALEIDIQASDILNRLDVNLRNIHDGFVERSLKIPQDFKYVRSIIELWNDEQKRRKDMNRTRLNMDVIKSRNYDYHWYNETEHIERLKKKISEDPAILDFETFGKQQDNKTPTVFEVVDSMFKPSAAFTEVSFDSSYDDSFWDNLDQKTINEIDDSIFKHSNEQNYFSIPVVDQEIPLAQSYLKKRALDTSSIDESSSSKSDELVPKYDLVKATRTESIYDFTSVHKSSPNSLARARRTMRFIEYQNEKQEKLSISPLTSTSAFLSLTPESRLTTLEKKVSTTFGLSNKVIVYPEQPIRSSGILDSLWDLGQPKIIYQKPIYRNDKDVPKRAREYAGKSFRLTGSSLSYLPDFTAGLERSNMPTSVDHSSKISLWQFSVKPPTRNLVQNWLVANSQNSNTNVLEAKRSGSQIEGPTLETPRSENKSKSFSLTSTTMSILSVEIHTEVRHGLQPDPEYDPISFIVWMFQSSKTRLDNSETDLRTGILLVNESSTTFYKLQRVYGSKIQLHSSELELVNSLVHLVRTLDPDILVGFEIQSSSWGYLIERANMEFDYDLSEELSRIREINNNTLKRRPDDKWGTRKATSINIPGRHVLNIWRLLRGSVSLLQYSLQNCAFQLLKRRIPYYSAHQLREWMQSGNIGAMKRTIEYFLSRAQLNLEFLKDQEIIEKTCEQARVIGVDFLSVIRRGSQFRIESLVFRIAKAENYMVLSPSRAQVGQQNALECLPLVMEPKSNFYTDPVVVLDFQALYPSIMIAFNYCYSTCLGRVKPWLGRNKLGVLRDLEIPKGLFSLLKDDLTVSPNGMIFVKSNVRQSLLSKMLKEILETRAMVKAEMKGFNEPSLQKLLNGRQLALKYIAAVTYGYTTASFSGRMPCAEIADAIVQTGREILEQSIRLINQDTEWKAEVVYGDTDSLFVHLPGRSKDEAFEIGKEIVDKISAKYPSPVKLKLEKVYLPCILQAKKRYVGFMYETPAQKEPTFDAKGMETVRRDGTPAEQKIEQKLLQILAESRDLSAAKEYFCRMCTKIMRGRVSVQDFCFAKEVRMGTYSDHGRLPPGANISAQKMAQDHRAEPQYGERVPYVVIAGPAGSRLVDRCVSPETFLANDAMFLDAEYYITKNLIPPLERIFNLMGVNVRAWYDEMPKVNVIPYRLHNAEQGLTARRPQNSTLHAYMRSAQCIVCKSTAATDISRMCDSCRKNPEGGYFNMKSRERLHQQRLLKLEQVCRFCTGLSNAEPISCESRDCGIYYGRKKEEAKISIETRLCQEYEQKFDLSW